MNLAPVAPGLSKGFGPNPITAGGTSTLTLTIDNTPAVKLVTSTVTVQLPFAEMTVTVDPAPAGSNTFESRVLTSADDAEESDRGRVSLSNPDLELVFDRGEQTVGLRFVDVEIPHGATILNSYVQFQSDETNNEPTVPMVRAEAIDDAPALTSSSFGISARS